MVMDNTLVAVFWVEGVVFVFLVFLSTTVTVNV
jgi:hypothetical protein